jgi:SOS-response transcriptional repressor LexA
MRRGADAEERAIGVRLERLLRELGLTQTEAAERAGVDPSTIHNIVRLKSPRPSAQLLKQILDGLGVTMGRFFGEPSLELTESDAALLHECHELLGRWLAADTALRAARQQQPRPSLRRRRRRTTAKVKRGVASAGPRETYPDVHRLPDETIPPDYYKAGARLAYEVDGDSMIGAGIVHTAIVYVRPTQHLERLDGKIAICRLNGSDYVKRVDTRGGRILLRSENPLYEPLPVDEDVDTFSVVGEVIL